MVRCSIYGFNVLIKKLISFQMSFTLFDFDIYSIVIQPDNVSIARAFITAQCSCMAR